MVGDSTCGNTQPLRYHSPAQLNKLKCLRPIIRRYEYVVLYHINLTFLVGLQPERNNSGSIVYHYLKSAHFIRVWSSGIKRLRKGKFKQSFKEELDQSSFHPLIKHPETDISRPGIEPRPLMSQADTIKALPSRILIRSDYSEPLVFVLDSWVSLSSSRREEWARGQWGTSSGRPARRVGRWWAHSSRNGTLRPCTCT